MSYVAPDYKPSMEVELAHSFPRFGLDGSPVSENTWAFTSNNIGNIEISGDSPLAKYVAGLIVLPTIILLLGVVSVVIFQLCLLLRWCCICIRCAPDEEEVSEHVEKTIKRRNRIFYLFWFFMLLMLIADHLLYYGNADLKQGIDLLIRETTKLKEIFDSILNLVDKNLTQSIVLKTSTTELKNGICGDLSDPANQPYEQYIDILNDAAGTIVSGFEGIKNVIAAAPDSLQTVITNADSYGRDYKDKGMFALYGVILSVNLIFMFGSFLAIRFVMYVGVFIGEIAILAGTTMCVVVMIVLTAYADFCMDPTGNIGNMTGSQGSKDMINYFAKCTGTDPFTDPISQAQDGITQYGDALGNAKPLCDNNNSESPVISNAQAATDAIVVNFTGIKTELDCEALSKIYQGFIQEGVCRYSFGGLFKVWACAFAASVACFFVMWTASIMWQYFGIAWKLKPSEADRRRSSILGMTNSRDSTDSGAPAANYKSEYTFTPASPNQNLTRRDIEMI